MDEKLSWRVKDAFASLEPHEGWEADWTLQLVAEVAALEAELAGLRAALKAIADKIDTPGEWIGEDAAIMQEIAERALAAAQDKDGWLLSDGHRAGHG